MQLPNIIAEKFEICSETFFANFIGSCNFNFDHKLLQIFQWQNFIDFVIIKNIVFRNQFP